MRPRPIRLQNIMPIGVDRMAAIADRTGADILRLENLDVDIPPDPDAILSTQQATFTDKDNSYLPFIGQRRLREVAAAHVSRISGVEYSSEHNCVITPGGLSGILNVLLASIEVGDEVIVTDPTYAGLINRVRLAGGVPRFAPFRFAAGERWVLDRDAMTNAVGDKTRAMLLMSPSMPSGACLNAEDWRLIAGLCVKNDLLLILDAAMERLVFDGRVVIHPAGLPGMAIRTVTVGSASKEMRMIGWRVGWIVGPEHLMPDIIAVSLSNAVVPVGIAQEAAAVALERSNTSIAGYVAELQLRRDAVVRELSGLPVGIPDGGWSVLLRVSDYGIDGEDLADRLIDHGVAATGMAGWGEAHGPQYVRFVFSNEPVQRLKTLGARVRAALQI